MDNKTVKAQIWDTAGQERYAFYFPDTFFRYFAVVILIRSLAIRAWVLYIWRLKIRLENMCFNSFQSNIDNAMVDRVNELTIEEIKLMTVYIWQGETFPLVRLSKIVNKFLNLKYSLRFKWLLLGIGSFYCFHYQNSKQIPFPFDFICKHKNICGWCCWMREAC